MEQTGKFSNGRAALGLLALVILAAAQLGAQLLASLPLMVGAPVWLGNVLAGVLYAALGVAGLLLLCGKGLRVTPEECRFAPVRLRPVWAASAVLMPALAAVMAAVPGEHEIVGAARLRIKESDRLFAMESVLNALGADVRATPDGLRIRGRALEGGHVDGAGDHRVVMSCAIAATACRNSVVIDGAEAADKSYPAFFEDFTALGGKCDVQHVGE